MKKGSQLKLVSVFAFLLLSFLVLLPQKAETKKNAGNLASKKEVSVRKKMNHSQPRMEEEGYIRHRVRKGETLKKIASAYGVKVEEIKFINGLSERKLVPGMIILIPSAENDPDEEEVVDITQFSYGKWKDPEERYRLVKVAKSFVGAPYKLGGSTVRGLDCSAFVRKIFEIFDVDLPRTAREQYKVGRRIEKEELAVGDLVFFKTRPGRDYPTHVGIYIGNGNFIHASSYQKRGVRIDSLEAPFYRRTYVGAVRVKDLPDEVAETKNQPSRDRNP